MQRSCNIMTCALISMPGPQHPAAGRRCQQRNTSVACATPYAFVCIFPAKGCMQHRRCLQPRHMLHRRCLQPRHKLRKLTCVSALAYTSVEVPAWQLWRVLACRKAVQNIHKEVRTARCMGTHGHSCDKLHELTMCPNKGLRQHQCLLSNHGAWHALMV